MSITDQFRQLRDMRVMMAKLKKTLSDHSRYMDAEIEFSEIDLSEHFRRESALSESLRHKKGRKTNVRPLLSQ